VPDVSAAEHVALPRSLELAQQCQRKWMKLVDKRRCDRELDMLLIQSKQGTMDLGSRFTVYRCAGLRLEGELARIRPPSEHPGRLENFFLQSPLFLQNMVEDRRIEERADCCGKVISRAVAGRIWKKRDRGKLD
jgi:hypothetical protein